MGITIWIFLFFILAAALAYHHATSKLWTLTLSISALTLTFWVSAGFWFTTLVWILVLLVLIPLNMPELRRNYVTSKIYCLFKSQLPSMSQTEQEALDAGTIWWEEDLFSGSPNWKRLLNFREPQLTSEEQLFIDGPTQQLCDLLDDWKITEELHDLPEEIWQFVKNNGFFGMIIPKEYGGKQFSAFAHSQVVMKIASRSTSAAVTVMVPNSLGPAKLLLHYGTQAQKDRYLPKLAKGEEVPCFALTSPDAGSDAASMTDYGIVCKATFEGQEEVVGIRLNWEKRYITLGPVATVLGLAFKLYDPDHLLGKQYSLGITLALIPTNTAGVDIGNRHFPLNIAFQNGPNRGKDVFIPLDWVIGGAAQIGRGWRMLVECLADGRGISLPSLAVGAGKLMCRGVGAYARIRKQFKTPIGNFEGVEEALARIAGNTYAMDAARTLTLGALDDGENPSVVSAIVKYHLTERMRTIINDGMDIQGGAGICLGPKNLIARAYQSIPISITVEGANILTRSLIIFGQGAVRAHPFVLKEMKALSHQDTEKGLIDFDDVLSTHIAYTMSNATRSFWRGLTNGKMSRVPMEGVARGYCQQLTRFSSCFALLADFSMMLLGSSLKRKERLSSRLGDILSNLYIGSAILKRYKDQGSLSKDRDLFRWACEDSLFRIQTSIQEILRNFPNRPLALLLHLLIFPLGAKLQPPSDRLCKQVAALLLEPGDIRDRLTKGIYIDYDPIQPLGKLESALAKVIAAEPIERILYQRLKRQDESIASDPREDRLLQLVKAGLLNEEEARILRLGLDARRNAIMVDEFPQNYWKKATV